MPTQLASSSVIALRPPRERKQLSPDAILRHERREFELRLPELARLDDLDYALQRNRVAKELGIQATVLDKERTRLREPGDDLLYEHWRVEPWDEPVETAALLHAVTER